eukprot:GEMP01000618.1.p1 GENE.GEMP01000618.1~~GEMP01000618.1.p1  ORF type:complete len:724 (+),score=145.02 GEMP01000618.1:233-2404(+)
MGCSAGKSTCVGPVTCSAGDSPAFGDCNAHKATAISSRHKQAYGRTDSKTTATTAGHHILDDDMRSVITCSSPPCERNTHVSVDNKCTGKEDDFALERRVLTELTPLFNQLRNSREKLKIRSEENEVPAWLAELKPFDQTANIGQVRPYVWVQQRCESFNEMNEGAESVAKDMRPSQQTLCCSFDDVFTSAQVVALVFINEVNRICVNTGAHFVQEDQGGNNTIFKMQSRADEKVKDRYGGNFSRLFDVLRTSIVCDDFESLRATWELVCAGSWRIARLKNRFREASALTGYRDLLMVLEVESEGVVHYCELQVHYAPFFDVPSEYPGFRRFHNAEVLQNICREPLDLCLRKNLPSLCAIADGLGLHQLHFMALSRMVAHSRRANGSHSVDISKATASVVNNLLVKGQIADAEKLLLEVGDSDLGSLGPEVAGTYAALHEHAKSAALYRLLLEKNADNDLAKRGLALLLLETSTSRDNDAEAERLVQDCAGDDPWLKGKLLEVTVGCDAALPLYAQAVADATNSLGDRHPMTLDRLYDLGKCQVNAGYNMRSGQHKLWVVYSHRSKVFGPHHPLTLEAFRELANAVVMQGGSLDGVDRLLNLDMERLVQATNKHDPVTLAWFHTLGLFAKVKGDVENARACFQFAFDGRNTRFGANHRLTRESANELRSLPEMVVCRWRLPYRTLFSSRRKQQTLKAKNDKLKHVLTEGKLRLHTMLKDIEIE